MYDWNRITLKSEAKFRLKGFYWMAFAVCAIATVAPDVLYNFIPMPNFQIMLNDPDTAMSIINSSPFQFWGVYLFVLGMGVIISTFVLNPINVGVCKFFIEADEGRVDFRNILYAFKSNYLNIVKVMFLKNLFITLWYFVFLIPGIVKTYQYYFVEFSLAEDSSISFHDARNTTFDMTKNDKLNIFILNLSFFGWIMLGSLLLGVGTFFVLPYIMETDARLYKFKKLNNY